MDNVNQPPGEPAQDPSAQPFRFTPGWPGGHAGYGPGYAPGPGYGPPPWPPQPPAGPGQPPGGTGQPPGGPGPQRRPGKHGPLLRRAGWIAAATVLAAGGTLAGLTLAGGSAPANATQAQALNEALSSSAAPAGAARCRLAAASSSPGSRIRAGRCRRALLLRLARGMYGQVAYHGKDGTVTLAFERGTVQSAGGGHLVIRAADGTTWTWDLASSSVVREHGTTVPDSSLSSGEQVFAAGKVSGSTRDARLVLIRPANASHPGSSSSRSPARSSAA